MKDMRQTASKITVASLRWATSLTLLALILQLVVALILNAAFQGKKEFSSDLPEYRNYVAMPTVLLNPPPGINMVGGWVAAPLLPFMLTIIYRPLVWLGANEFLAFRGTMIFWLTLGFWLSLNEIFRRWGPPGTKRDVWLALALTCSPLTWLPSAVLAQDEAVAAFWSGLCFVFWSRRGVWACWAVAAIGVFVAKPFILVFAAGLWMAYPAQRKTLVVATSALLFSLLTFMYMRDGEISFLTRSVAPAMNGSLYAVGWLLDGTVTYDQAKLHYDFARMFSKYPTLLGMGGYALLALRFRFTFPSALVGLYCVMFTVMVGMMPEYELWYWSWSMLLIWIACRRGEWLLGSLLYFHSVLGYAYKILYSCDSKNFFVLERKPTAIWYDQYIGLDLWWVMVLLSIVLFLNTLVLAILLWRKFPQLVEQEIPRAA
jgi:hypothetical protein